MLRFILDPRCLSKPKLKTKCLKTSELYPGTPCLLIIPTLHWAPTSITSAFIGLLGASGLRLRFTWPFCKSRPPSSLKPEPFVEAHRTS